MLLFILKKEYYEKYKRGEKNTEYREYKNYWHRRFNTAYHNFMYEKYWNKQNVLFPLYFDELRGTALKVITKDFETGKYMTCILQNGYSSRERMSAEIEYITVCNGKSTDLNVYAPVYAIKLKNIKIMTNKI